MALYHVSIHHNLAPETIDCVKESQLESAEVTRAVSTYITYEPSSGQIDVLSKNRVGREVWARLVADLLLKSPITGDRIPLKQYDYQCLSRPFLFDIADEDIDWVKVTQLGYSKPHRVLEFKIGVKETQDIHAAATVTITPDFQFRNHKLTLARITLRIRKQVGERARTIHILLRNQNSCNIGAKREKDRVLCKGLLEKWGIIKEVG